MHDLRILHPATLKFTWCHPRLLPLPVFNLCRPRRFDLRQHQPQRRVQILAVLCRHGNNVNVMFLRILLQLDEIFLRPNLNLAGTVRQLNVCLVRQYDVALRPRVNCTPRVATLFGRAKVCVNFMSQVQVILNRMQASQVDNIRQRPTPFRVRQKFQSESATAARPFD